MSSKIQERIYLEWFLHKKGVECQAIEVADPPDFLLTCQNRRIGVEVTNIFYESTPGRKGSKRKRDESHRTKWIKELSEAYYQTTEVPIDVNILLPRSGFPYQTASDHVLAAICKSGELAVGEDKRHVLDLHQGTIKVFVYRLAEACERYSGWTCINDSMGWVAPVSEAHIVNAIRRKQQKLVYYRSVCDEVWLLIVVDGSSRSSMLRFDRAVPPIEDSGFASIWLVEYLTAVYCLRG